MSAAVDVKTLQIDGTGRKRARRPDHPRSGAGEQHRHPHALPPRRASDVGACRLCLVEVKGSNKLSAGLRHDASKKAWKSPPTTERLQKHRRTILELLFAERNHVCSVCVSNGHCELQALAQEQGLTTFGFPIAIPS